MVERRIKLASAQMQVNPAPTAERLSRAETLVAQASQAGAQLVVLPELFNTGYAYIEDNFHLAEGFEGPTVRWLEESAARHQVHLAGSLLLLEGSDIYNALLLMAPDGRRWRYDKNYPWGWERAFFRRGSGVRVARTDLGDIGMLICWDLAHASLWRRYTGQVDLMLVTSCPPDIANPTYRFPSGEQMTIDDMGALANRMRNAGRLVFEGILSQQTAWLGVPAVNSVGCGRFHSPIPKGKASSLTLLPAAPHLTRYLSQSNGVELSCEMIAACKVLDAQGSALADRSQVQGEGFVLAEVELPERKPSPKGPQPKMPLSRLVYSYADVLLPALMRPVYRRGMRRLEKEKLSQDQRLPKLYS